MGVKNYAYEENGILLEKCIAHDDRAFAIAVGMVHSRSYPSCLTAARAEARQWRRCQGPSPPRARLTPARHE